MRLVCAAQPLQQPRCPWVSPSRGPSCGSLGGPPSRLTRSVTPGGPSASAGCLVSRSDSAWGALMDAPEEQPHGAEGPVLTLPGSFRSGGRSSSQTLGESPKDQNLQGDASNIAHAKRWLPWTSVFSDGPRKAQGDH